MNDFALDAEVPGGVDAPRVARGLVQRELYERVPATVIEDVALLVTELVANGVIHGGARTGSGLRLRLSGGASALRVEVADPGAPGGAVARRAGDLGGGGGLGLQIVDTIASRWGVATGPPTTVWFELDQPGLL